MNRIKKGDTVKIITGKDRGKVGTVIKVNSKKNSVVVEGLNLYKKHQRPRNQNEKGQIVTVPRPIHISNVMPYCEKCKNGSRVGIKKDGDKKIRFCKRCQANL